MGRRWIRALVITVMLLAGVSAAAVLTTQTAWFRDRLRGYIVQRANQSLNGQLAIRGMSGNLFSGVQLDDVSLTVEGREAVAIRKVDVKYNAIQLITKGISIDHVRLEEPVVRLWRSGDGWAIARIVKAASPGTERTPPGRPIAVEQIGIADGTVVIEDRDEAQRLHIPSRIERLNVGAAFHYQPVRYAVDVAYASFRGADPDLTLTALSGGVTVGGGMVQVRRVSLQTPASAIRADGSIEGPQTERRVNITVASDKLSLPELAPLFPVLAGRPVTPAFDLALNGPMNRLNITLGVRSSAGDVAVKAAADLDGAQRSINGDFDLRHVNLAPFLAGATDPSDLTVSGHADLRGGSLAQLDQLAGDVTYTSPHLAVVGLTADHVRGSAAIRGRAMTIDARAGMFGAAITAAGRLVLPSGGAPLTYDMRGTATDVDLRKLPAAFKIPPAPTVLNAEYHAAGRGGQSVDVNVNLRDSTVAGARIDAPSTASFSKAGDRMAYSADATIAELDLLRIGRAFGVDALDSDRYASTLNGHVVMNGSGTSAADLDIAANGTLDGSRFAAGRIDRLTFDTTFRADTLHVKAAGTFADLNPAVLSERPAVAGAMSGDLDVDTTIAHISDGLSIDGVQAAGRISLTSSRLGGLGIDRAAIDGSYRNGAGEIRQFELAGPDLMATASGAIALNEDGQSNLIVCADAPNLETLTKLVNQQAKGTASVSAKITGNRRDLRATGTVTANDAEFRGQSALQLASDVTLQVRDLAFAHADVTASTNATFAIVGGQSINELAARTEYHDRNIAFDVTAKQPQRSLSADGSLVLDPAQNQVRLNRFAFQTANVSWQSAPDARAEIRYGNGTVAVRDLRLVSGNQELVVAGTFGQADDALQVTAQNVSLATIDAMLLRPPMLSGDLNASVEIAGTSEAPKVAAKFDVGQGSFRQVHFESLAGTVNYGGRGLTVDAKLQQSATASLEARGYVPVAAFRQAASPDAGAPAAAASADDAFDLHVHSTPVDLGLVQGMTTALTGVRGTMQATIDVTGPAADPRPSGFVTIENGAFTVAPTGVTYTDLDGRIELQPDRIHIVDIEVLDNDQQPLSITGDLAIRQWQLGGVNVDVTARNFKIIKNKMGDLRMDSDVRITGDLLKPRIEGDLGVTSGVINLDPVLAALGGPSSAPEPTAYRVRGGSLGRGPADPALVDRVNTPEGAERPTVAGEPPAPSASSSTAPAADAASASPGGFSALTMDVHLTLANDFVLRSNDLTVPNAPIGLGTVNITIGGDLRLVKREGRDVVRLVGSVKTVRGTYDFQGRRFTVLRDGTIRFEGGRDINPDLNVSAERAIQGVLAKVNVRGTLRMPELVLTSVPPLERSDILSLIVFNQPINQLGEGQQVALSQRAEQLAAGALASTLSNSLGKALNLTEFSIQAGNEVGSTAQVTAGEQLNANLYAKLEQGFGDVSTTNFILEYEFAKWLRLRTNWLQGSNAQPLLFQRTQDSGVDLLFTFTR